MIGGIVFWSPTDQVVTESAVRAMAHRAAGGRAQVCAEHGSVGLFNSNGRQRLESAGHVWAVADMDLTNLAELQALAGRQNLETGLLATLYRMEGPRFLRRLRGAFALALWDSQDQTLLLAIDRFGMKRLHYVSDGHRAAFASKPTALLAAPRVEGRLDLTAIYNYLNFGYVPAPDSIFAEVARLEPGHYLLLSPGRAVREQYWDASYGERAISEAEAAATVYRLTEEAVADALQDVTPKQAGAFLSGGTDSSTVLGLMTRVSGERVNAFSIGFDEDRYNELSYATLAARHFDATHYTSIVKPEDALAVLPALIEGYDEPFANNSSLGTLVCARLAREMGVTQLLAGDGGDEIFGGNERYRTDRIFARYQSIPGVVRRRVLEPVLLQLPEAPGAFGRAQRYIRRANIPNPRRFYSYEFFFAREGCELLSPDFRAAVAVDAPNTVIEGHYGRARATAELNRLLYLDLKLTIGDNDLLKVTRTAELADVGVRFPLLHPALVEFTNSLPASYKVRGLEKRYLFKRAFRTLLPEATLTKRKHGFGVPTSVWLKDHAGFRELARDTLLSSRTRQRGYFRHGAVETLFARHGGDSTPYYGDILWAVLMLELWHRRHFDPAKVA
jgi:asparagine synthase (glutamine-hydrolysing)